MPSYSKIEKNKLAKNAAEKIAIREKIEIVE